MQDEWPRLQAADASVEGDQLLERAALVEIGVVEAATINARPVAIHETTSENTLNCGRSGCQAVDWPYVCSGLLGVIVSSSGRW